jgi:hypothetical protein
MQTLEQFFTISLFIQLLHSIEELSTGFHKKWYLFKMSFWLFLVFEIVFSGFWISVLLLKSFPNRELLQMVFLVLMFANGVQHVIWAGITKKYVPGLVTAPIHIIVSLLYYFQNIN